MGNRLEGKIALVTACTRGIGRAIADLFVDEGAKVYYACRNMETGAAAVEAALPAAVLTALPAADAALTQTSTAPLLLPWRMILR